MAGSLGIFIDEKVIKYAKLKKDKDVIKVESFSVEFYEKENLISSLKKIISETNSEHDQINVNVSNEIYNYFEAFSMLEKKDIKDSVQIDFELLCGEKGYNAKALDTRFILTASKENSDKYKVLHVAVNKDDLNNLTKAFTGYKIGSITPVSTSVSNLIDIKDNESVVIGRGTFLIIGIYAAKDGTGAADGHPVAAGISRIGFCAIDKCRSPASHNINFANACNSRIRPHHKHTNFAIIFTKHAACNRNVTGCGIPCNIADGNCDSRFRNRRGGKAVHPPCAQQGSQYDSGQPFPDFRFLFQHVKHPPDLY